MVTFQLRPAVVAVPERSLRQFTFESGLQKSPTWSPDGRAVAFVSDRAGNSDLWVQALNEPQASQITTSPANESEPDWSPDGQSLVFRSESNGGGLFVVGARGGPVRKIANFGYKPRWSPDSKLVLFSSSGHRGGTPRFHVVEANGGEPRALPAAVFESITPHDAVEWRPDGLLDVRGATIEHAAVAVCDRPDRTPSMSEFGLAWAKAPKMDSLPRGCSPKRASPTHVWST